MNAMLRSAWDTLSEERNNQLKTRSEENLHHQKNKRKKDLDLQAVQKRNGTRANEDLWNHKSTDYFRMWSKEMLQVEKGFWVKLAKGHEELGVVEWLNDLEQYFKRAKL